MKRLLTQAALIFLIATCAFAQDVKRKTKVVAGKEYAAHGRYYEMLLGRGNRQLWITPIEIEILDLASHGGGLTPVRRVGGLQTSALALAGADGRAYTFRPAEKSATGLIPPEFIGTPLEDLVQDQMSAQNPAASVVVPELSEALGILETKHQLVVMPDDPLLGEFREDYKGMLGTISIFPLPASPTNPGSYGAEEIISTPDLWSYYKDDPDQRPDSEAYLKARLLDVLVGDWDRHQGQWRWAKIPDAPLWQPIPEDRDQALSNYDGFAMAVARLTGLPQFNKFESSYPSMGGLNFNAWPLDRLILTELSRSDWQRVAREVQKELTEADIDRALAKMPTEYLELVGPLIKSQLISRRDLLQEAAGDFYLHLAGEVDIACTDDDELVRLLQNQDGTLEIEVFRAIAWPSENSLASQQTSSTL